MMMIMIIIIIIIMIIRNAMNVNRCKNDMKIMYAGSTSSRGGI